jgi:hypothetical protein
LIRGGGVGVFIYFFRYYRSDTDTDADGTGQVPGSRDQSRSEPHVNVNPRSAFSFPFVVVCPNRVFPFLSFHRSSHPYPSTHDLRTLVRNHLYHSHKSPPISCSPSPLSPIGHFPLNYSSIGLRRGARFSVPCRHAGSLSRIIITLMRYPRLRSLSVPILPAISRLLPSLRTYPLPCYCKPYSHSVRELRQVSHHLLL